MKRKPKTTRPKGEGWFSLSDAQRAFGKKSPRGFRDFVRPHLPADAIHGGGRGQPTWIHLPRAIAAYVGYQVAKATPDTAASELRRRQRDDLKLRAEAVRVDLAELSLAQRRGELLRRAEVRATYELLAAAVRAASDRIRTRHGSEPAAELDQCLHELEMALANIPAPQTDSSVPVAEAVSAIEAVS